MKTPCTEIGILYIGDKDGRPMIRADILAHELTHGVTIETAGLIYNNGQSGALNESFSDIMGILFEYWLAKKNSADPADFLIGEDV